MSEEANNVRNESWESLDNRQSVPLVSQDDEKRILDSLGIQTIPSVKRGDKRVQLGQFSEPPSLAVRVLAEHSYQKLLAEIHRLKNITTKETKRLEKEASGGEVDYKNHLPPKYYGYVTGTFAAVNICIRCNLRGLSEDLHEVDPCPKCGGELKEMGAAKYARNVWVPSEYTKW